MEIRHLLRTLKYFLLAVMALFLLTACSQGSIALEPVEVIFAGFGPSQFGLFHTPTAAIPTITPTLQPSPTFTVTLTPFQPMPTATITPTPIPPTETPEPPPEIPEAASVPNIYGTSQLLPLDCESNSATDFARYFGVNIDELEFFHALPVTDDPETGFVGSVWGPASLPPYGYGVHSGPVSALLRAYGLNAWERRNMSFDEVKSEIAAGRPVMVWVIGSVFPGSPVTYTASSGATSTVAYLEHTVMVIGYDSGGVTIADADMVYYRTYDQFFSSWGVLDNMAIVVE